MANSRLGNIIFVDTAGLITDELNIKVSDIIFTSSGAGDSVILKETSSGAVKLSINESAATNTKHIPLSKSVVFSQGIYVQSISAGASLMLVIG